ncbi:sensor histidine kinase [Photobacterium sanguinicancri]|uniref:histidine kinase n=1 Tax=Photobacterium sanguinicancri TaxID=875932 RepID=A0AAW7XYG4_9GAMM|nr:HAMP domain-containing sensor histidine kinase [Photobacterium sanguinicancri]MDO6541356.1 HAMP domain-containing sensor histidine kinase [Photobacterium sanguinicancri]
MKSIKSAKQITFFYFSIVAVIIIAIHLSVFVSTVTHLEKFNARNRLAASFEQALPAIHLGNMTEITIPPYDTFYVGDNNLPSSIQLPDNLELGRATEVYKQGEVSTDFYIVKYQLDIGGRLQNVYGVNIDPVYERSETEMFEAHIQSILISTLLILACLYVVLRITERLTSPLSGFARQLEQRSADDLSPLTLPKAGVTQELKVLVDSFNSHQAQVRTVLERERAFNRFASHELRTPLMVIKGGLSLLGQSTEPSFVEKQRQRMLTAANDMNDFVTTLLTLTRDENQDQAISRPLLQVEIERVIASHKELLTNKPVVYQLSVQQQPHIKAPEAAVKILVGNIIKNAFTYTEAGSITVVLTEKSLTVTDTGIGLGLNQATGEQSNTAQGYGLGLLIANDICRKYGWQLTMKDRQQTGDPQHGCCATIRFSS